MVPFSDLESKMAGQYTSRPLLPNLIHMYSRREGCTKLCEKCTKLWYHFQIQIRKWWSYMPSGQANLIRVYSKREACTKFEVDYTKLYKKYTKWWYYFWVQIRKWGPGAWTFRFADQRIWEPSFKIAWIDFNSFQNWHRYYENRIHIPNSDLEVPIRSNVRKNPLSKY